MCYGLGQVQEIVDRELVFVLVLCAVAVGVVEVFGVVEVAEYAVIAEVVLRQVFRNTVVHGRCRHRPHSKHAEVG